MNNLDKTMEQNEQEVVVPNENNEDIELDLELDNEEVDVDALKKENETLKAQKEHWRKKANEKPEAKENASNNQLSLKDQIALSKADIDVEDIDDVLEYASFRKISIAEALSSSIVKTMISEKNEQRKASKAMSAGTTSRNANKNTDEALVRNAEKGELPESEADIQRLWLARKGLK